MGRFKLHSGAVAVRTVVRLTPDQKELLRAMAVDHGLTISDVIRQMINHCLEEDGKE